MPTCPVCGGNVSAQDQTCPYCGKTQLHLGGGAEDAFQWDLLSEDGTAVTPPQPGAWAPPTGESATGGDTSVLSEDWLLSDQALDSQAPLAAPPQQPWAPAAPAEAGLPPWDPAAAPVPAGEDAALFDFSF